MKGVCMELQMATLAGGCFWGVEELFSQLNGVTNTEVGYTGGEIENPNYSQIKTGKTGHAESIQLQFDSQKISYIKILEYFFRLHDPTTLNRQGNDVGSQYRSAIFYHTLEQKKLAEEIKIKVNSSGKWQKPIVTEILAYTKFYSAEDFHQKYLKKNPNGYTCHFLRD